MPQKIPNEVRASLLRDWLSGKPRDTITHDNMVSAGAVTYNINEWRNALGVADSDALRELGIIFRKLGITASQSAIGFRLASILKDLGVDEDNFRNFVSQVYNRCKDIGLQPECIAYNTKQILDLSGSIPISEIPNYIQEKTNERQKLEEDIEKLEAEELEARATLMVALDENKVSLAELEQFSNLKVQLAKLGISTEDIPRTIGIIQGVQKSGYNLDTIKELVSSWEASRIIQAQLEKNIEELTHKKTKLEEECECLERAILAHQQKDSVFKELKAIGCGLRELKLLFYMIKEVAAENKIPENLAVQKFFEDIQKNYDNKLGLDSTLERLKSEIERTNKELNITRSELAFNRVVAQVVTVLLSNGYSEQQLVSLGWDLTFIASNVSLKDDLKKYGGLKKAIEGLNQELSDLKISKTSLRMNTQDIGNASNEQAL